MSNLDSHIWCYTTDPATRFEYCDPIDDGGHFHPYPNGPMTGATLNLNGSISITAAGYQPIGSPLAFQAVCGDKSSFPILVRVTPPHSPGAGDT